MRDAYKADTKGWCDCRFRVTPSLSSRDAGQNQIHSSRDADTTEGGSGP
jgi:hypothetical protein